MELRVARHTDRLEEVTAFYRDGLRLPELGRFSGHDGYDGVFLAIPGTRTHIELTTGGGHVAPEPHPESLLVLYLDTQEELDAIASRIEKSETTPANPYWRHKDGCQVLLTLAAKPST